MKLIVKTDKSLLTRLEYTEQASRLLGLIIDSNPLTDTELESVDTVIGLLNNSNIHRRANWEYDEYEFKEDYII